MLYHYIYMKIKDLPLHLRPREKLIEKGSSALKDHELLAILLRTGTKHKNVLQLAESIIRQYPPEVLIQISFKELKQIDGVDISKASSLIAAFEFTSRAFSKNKDRSTCIESPEDAVRELGNIRNLKKEHFVVLFLNARNQLIQKETISIGTLNASLVHPREVFEPAIRSNAAALIVAHNHPSGDTNPSEADIRITSQLVDAGGILGIELVDHLIVTSTHFVSLKAEGYIK